MQLWTLFSSQKGTCIVLKKMASFADVQYCIYADKVGGLSIKKAQNVLTYFSDGPLPTLF